MSGSGKKLTEKQKKELAEKQKVQMLQDIRNQAGGLTREGVHAKKVLAGGASRVVAPYANIFLQGLTDIETRLNKENKTITLIPERLKSRIEQHAKALKDAERANITGLTLQQINEQKEIISQITELKTENMPAKRQGVNVVSALASSLGGLMSSLRRKSSSGEGEGAPTISAPMNVQKRNFETGELESQIKVPSAVARNPLKAPMLPTVKAKEEPKRTAVPPPLPLKVLARRAAQEQEAKKQTPPPVPKRAPAVDLHGQIQQGANLKHVEDKYKRDRSAPDVKKQYSNTSGNRTGDTFKPVPPPRPAAPVLPSQKKLGGQGGTPKPLTQTGQELTIDQKLAAAKEAKNAQKKEPGNTPSWVKKKGPNDY